MTQKRKFKLGDRIDTSEWGSGEIVAMTKTWCIFESYQGAGEVAALWSDGVWVIEEADPPENPEGSILYFEIP